MSYSLRTTQYRFYDNLTSLINSMKDRYCVSYHMAESITIDDLVNINRKLTRLLNRYTLLVHSLNTFKEVHILFTFCLHSLYDLIDDIDSEIKSRVA